MSFLNNKNFILHFIIILTWAQSYCQKIYSDFGGVVLEENSGVELLGATIELFNEKKTYRTVSDESGYFNIPKVLKGVYKLKIQYVGYNTLEIEKVQIRNVQDRILNYYLEMNNNYLKQVIIIPDDKFISSINNLTKISSYHYSYDFLDKTPGTFSDPIRIAQNFPGVVSAGDDLTNEIVVRGNSPRYTGYYIDGIQIKNPNHFSSAASGGGAISIISGQVLGESRLHTGNFHSEFGNNLGGVFQFNFKNVSTQTSQKAFRIGISGLEASFEGPIDRNKRSTYLVNYRYSSLALLSKVANLDLEDFKPNYQDLSFKFKFPSVKGSVEVIGLYGSSFSNKDIDDDQSNWLTFADINSFKENNKFLFLGIKKKYIDPNNKFVFNTSLSINSTRNSIGESFIDIADPQGELVENSDLNFSDDIAQFNFKFSYPLRSKLAFEFGGNYSVQFFNYLFNDRLTFPSNGLNIIYTDPITHQNSKGQSTSLIAYGSVESKVFQNLRIRFGLNYLNQFFLKKSRINPNFQAVLETSENVEFALSLGRHSLAEDMLTYLVQRGEINGIPNHPNLDLKLSKSTNFELSSKIKLSKEVSTTINFYYQKLHDIPFDSLMIQKSLLNVRDIFEILFSGNELENTSHGINKGIELKADFLSDKLGNFSIISSISNSSFFDQYNSKYNTLFNSKYSVGLVGGYVINSDYSKNLEWGFSYRAIHRGGFRYSNYDFENFVAGKIYELQLNPYTRVDFSTYLKFDEGERTHRLKLECQNIFNIKNVREAIPNFGSMTFNNLYHNGIIPNVSYELKF